MKKIFALIIIIFSFVGTARASTFYFEDVNQEIIPNQKFAIEVFLNADGESINAVEGNIAISSHAKIVDVNSANSFVDFWIEAPTLNTDGSVSFSGIIPGGYQESDSLLLTIEVLTQEEGEVQLFFTNQDALLNDGLGTKTVSSSQLLKFVVSKDAPILEDTGINTTLDTESPDTFTPEIGKSYLLFDGQWFVAFSTQDKQSAIVAYEIQETYSEKPDDNSWVKANSPYPLEDQSLQSYIFVKAIDEFGNERISSVSPTYPLSWYEKWSTWFIIVLGLLCIFGGIRLWKIRSKNSLR